MNLRNKTFNSSGQQRMVLLLLLLLLLVEHRERGGRERKTGMHHNEIELRGTNVGEVHVKKERTNRNTHTHRLKGLSRSATDNFCWVDHCVTLHLSEAK